MPESNLLPSSSMKFGEKNEMMDGKEINSYDSKKKIIDRTWLESNNGNLILVLESTS
jgi:hypothetical protein